MKKQVKISQKKKLNKIIIFENNQNSASTNSKSWLRHFLHASVRAEIDSKLIHINFMLRSPLIKLHDSQYFLAFVFKVKQFSIKIELIDLTEEN